MSDTAKQASSNYHAPIVEAVISFDCELPPAHTLNELKTEVPEYLQSAYPIKQNTKAYQHSIKPGKENIELNISPQNERFRFLQEDKKQLTQFKTDGFSFNRLAPYTSLDEYLEEITKLWLIYLEVAKPVTLKRISMRYINRINIPRVENTIDLADYVTITPATYPGGDLQFAGIFQSIQFICPHSQAKAQLTLATEDLTPTHIPIIVDIEAFLNLNQDPSSFIIDAEEIRNLRKLKNLIYQTTLTEKCQNLFQV
jgi:uncharacterized protein (TIGR04255 family)